jgi:hypothetical protein
MESPSSEEVLGHHISAIELAGINMIPTGPSIVTAITDYKGDCALPESDPSRPAHAYRP